MKVLSIVSLALAADQVAAHGYLSQPAAPFVSGINTKYNALITESIDPAFAGKKWDDNPVANTKMFTDSFASSAFKTLGAMLDTAVPDCGNTLLSGTRVDVSSLSSMKWQNDQEQQGFVSSHHGPCEAWIGKTRVFHSDDCAAAYTGYPAEIPIDYSSCSGDCDFTFYWLALHEPNWQVYKQCAPISNSNGGGGYSPATVETGNEGEYETTDAPASTTAAPASTAPLITTVSMAAEPTSPSKNCKAKAPQRRMAANLRTEN